MRTAALLVWVSACAPHPGTHLVGAAKVFSQHLAQLVHLQSEALDDLSWPDALSKLDVTVLLQQDRIHCASTDHEALGCTTTIAHNVYQVVVTTDQSRDDPERERVDLQEGTLAHELLHIYAEVVLKDPSGDKDHVREWLWRTESYVFTRLPRD